MTDLMFTTKNGANFEKPDTGVYHGVLADIVDLGIVTTVFNGQIKNQPMVRFVWFLNQNGKDGKQLAVTARHNNNLHEKSNLYKTVKQILNAAPPVTLNPETLVGSVRKLFIQRDITGEGQQQKDFANIIGIMPADPGVTVAAPQDFVRDKNKTVDQQAKNKKKQAPGQQPGQPVQPGPAQPPANNPAALQAQLAVLQAQLAAAQQPAQSQGSDVKL